MKIKTKLHANQLYIPQNFIKKLKLGSESEVFLELDEDTQSLIVTSHENNQENKEILLDMIRNPPIPLKGNSDEDFKEYDYDDI